LHTKGHTFTTSLGKNARIAALVALLMLPACSSDEPPQKQSSPSPTTNAVSSELSGSFKTGIKYPEFVNVPGPTHRDYIGVWKMDLDLEGVFYLIHHPGYGQVSGEVFIEGDVIVFNDPPAPEGAFNCFLPNGERTLEKGDGRYHFEVEADSLTLTVIDEPCPLREAILNRTWERI
jgi:hypothetical protein